MEHLYWKSQPKNKKDEPFYFALFCIILQFSSFYLDIEVKIKQIVHASLKILYFWIE